MSMPPSKMDDPCGGENICAPFCTACLLKLFWWNGYMMLKNQYHFGVVMSELHHLKPWKTGWKNFCVRCIDTRVGCETKCIDTQSKMHWPSRWRQALSDRKPVVCRGSSQILNHLWNSSQYLIRKHGCFKLFLHLSVGWVVSSHSLSNGRAVIGIQMCQIMKKNPYLFI